MRRNAAKAVLARSVVLNDTRIEGKMKLLRRHGKMSSGEGLLWISVFHRSLFTVHWPCSLVNMRGFARQRAKPYSCLVGAVNVTLSVRKSHEHSLLRHQSDDDLSRNDGRPPKGTPPRASCRQVRSISTATRPHRMIYSFVAKKGRNGLHLR